MIRERTSTAVGDWQSLRRRLPLLTTALLTIAVAAIAGTAYYEMKSVLLRAAGEHLRSVSQQMATAFATGEQRLEREGSPLSRDTLVRKALAHPDSATLAMARTALATRASAGQNMTVELWDAHRVRLMAVGADTQRTSALAMRTSAIGPLVAFGDTVLTQTQLPVITAAHDTLGFIRETSRVSSAQSKQLLAGLIGGRATLLVANVSGDVWTDLDRRVSEPAFGGKSGVSTTAVANGARWIGSLSAIPGTPWQIWVAAPEAEMLGQAHVFLVRMLIVALIVIALGFVGARITGQRIVGPIGELTRAAESLAGGEYATRARVSRSDEVGRMAVAFNKMATAIETALLELENQQVELETQQVELQEANEELRHTVSELTASREAEDRSNARASAVVAGAIDAVVTIDQDEHIVEFNPAAERAFGMSAGMARGRSIRDLLKAGPAVPAAERTSLPLIGNGARSADQRIELTASRADGTEFAVEMSITRIPIDGPPMFTCFLRDVSERKQLEAELQRSQKMEAIGRLAGGVAHDFNNMLTVIVSYADLVLLDRGIGATVREDLSQIRSAADRAAILTRQLLAFSRKQVLHPSVLDVNTVIGDVVSMLARVLPENIRVSPALGSILDPVYVDRGQLEQVIMNLAVNARDAMPDGGSLVIETENAELDDTYVAMHPGGKTGRHVVLSVRDTGIGMDAATRDRIFEPFFTTKPVGKGTGLGLATVYGIVRQSGGSIYVYSEPNHGTTFKIYLPSHLGVTDRSDSIEQPNIAESQPMTVLLVEDDPAVRGATEMVLTRLGHRVIPAPDVAVALGLVRGGGEVINIVLTDAVMAGQSGLDLADILRTERPDLPVILMSGYAEEAIDADASRMKGIMFVEKPFTAVTLANAIAAVRESGAGVG